jgi:hypothetical protein
MQQIAASTIGAEFRPAGLNGVTKTMLFAPLYLSLVAGTGGMYTAGNIQACFSVPPNDRIFVIRSRHLKEKQIFSVSERLVNLRDMFGLTMTEIAQIFRVSRPTAYAWLSGSEPKLEAKSRLIDLSTYVEDLRSDGVAQARVLARQPLVGGPSLIELLKSGADARSAIASIKQSAALTRGQRVKRDFGPAEKTIRVSIDEISIPISN